MERTPIVLIVDDNKAGRKALEAALMGKGYQLEFAESGNQTLEMVPVIRPDLVLLDVMMPEMDGFEVCRQLRANPNTAEVPIVMVTALDDHDSKLEGLLAGADDFVSKPYDRSELQARVRTITRLNRYHALLMERKRLRRLSQQVLEVQEKERRAVAVELHDEIGQGLTGLKLILDQALKECSNKEITLRLEQGLAISSNLIDKVRSLSLNLRPSMLDDFGLYPAMSWLVEQHKNQSGLEIEHNFSDQEDIRYPHKTETAIFRVAQEALTNISRHADADHVWLSLEERDDQLIIRIEDNGKGFDLPALLESKDQYSTGLSGMEERVRLAGGVLEIDPQVGHGTRVTAKFSLEGKY